MTHLATEVALHVGGNAIAAKHTVTTSTPSLSTTPLVLPQEGWHPDAPFVRAYAPLLAERDISPEAFTQALDAINESLLPSPTVKAMQIGSIATGLLMSASLLTATDARPGLALIAAAAGAANSTVFRPAGLSAS
jgi:hypothetical protein